MYHQEKTFASPAVVWRWLVLLTLLRLFYLAVSPLPLYGDEAQYWTWAQDLDFGYYSKPPMVAWIIALTTWLGSSESAFWIRLASPLLHTGTAIGLYYVGRFLFGKEVGAAAALIYATLPAVFLSSNVISTDPLLLLFWSWGLYFYAKAIDKRRARYWLMTGLLMGLAVLSKYTAVFFAIGILTHVLLDRRAKQSFFSSGRLTAFIVAGLVILPNILWNADNGWLTFQHTKDNANLANSGLHPHKAGEFFLSQFAVFGPLLFLALLRLFFGGILERQTTPRDFNSRLLLVSFIAPLFLFILAQAFISRANANWAAPVYLGGSVLVAAYLLKSLPGWLKSSVNGHTLIALVILLYAFVPGEILQARYDPAKRLRGFEEVTQQIRFVHEHYPESRLLTDHRMLTALLSYHGHATEKWHIVKWNPNAVIDDHYELTTTVKPGVSYILITPTDRPDIEARFEKSKHLQTITVLTHKDQHLSYKLTYLEGFKGYAPVAVSETE